MGIDGSLMSGGVFFVVHVNLSKSPRFSSVCCTSPTWNSCSFALSGAHSTSALAVLRHTGDWGDGTNCTVVVETQAPSTTAATPGSAASDLRR